MSMGKSGTPALCCRATFFQTSFRFICNFSPLNHDLCFHSSPLKDHLPHVLEAADPATPAKNNSQEPHTVHAQQPAATGDIIFLPPFSSFGGKCRLEVSRLL